MQISAAALACAFIIGALVVVTLRPFEDGQAERPEPASASPTLVVPGLESVRPESASTPPPTPSKPPLRFAAQVVHWCYCGDSDTLESQIKIKPRFVNHSSRHVDLRTGSKARLGLAIYAPATEERKWLSPTYVLYRRFGNWLVIPPNAPGRLVSSTSFESHRTLRWLRPHGEYFSAARYEGDLVFNVPPDLYLRRYNARLAYRLNNGNLYFPLDGAVGQWRGNEDGYNF